MHRDRTRRTTHSRAELTRANRKRAAEPRGGGVFLQLRSPHIATACCLDQWFVWLSLVCAVSALLSQQPQRRLLVHAASSTVAVRLTCEATCEILLRAGGVESFHIASIRRTHIAGPWQKRHRPFGTAERGQRVLLFTLVLEF